MLDDTSVYRSDDEAMRARVMSAFERKREAAAALRRLRAEPSPAEESFDVDATGIDLSSVAEAFEREADRLEREAREYSRSSARRSAAPPRAKWPKAEASTRSQLGAALARHVSVARRLRTIAPLVHAAQAAREQRAIEPGKLLAPRPARGAEDGASIRALTVACDDAERELERLGLGEATGTSADRVRDAAVLRELVANVPKRSRALVALSDVLAQYDAAVGALATRDMVARGSHAALGELPEVSFESEASLDQSAASVRAEVARLRSAFSALSARPASRSVRAPESAPYVATLVDAEPSLFWPSMIAWLVIVVTIGGAVALIGSGRTFELVPLCVAAAAVWRRFVRMPAPRVRIDGRERDRVDPRETEALEAEHKVQDADADADADDEDEARAHRSSRR